MDSTPRHRGAAPLDNPFQGQRDVEAGPAAAPQIAAPVKPAAKPVAKPPNPILPRAIAAVAILLLLAIPVVVPLAVMKATGRSGKQFTELAAAIQAPPVVQVAPSEETTVAEQKESFLKISNATFERFCRPYYSSGFNAYELVETTMVSSKANTVGGKSGAQIVDDVLAQAAAAGMNTVRMWAHTTSEVFPFQTQAGVYDERGVKALDYVLETARKYGLQVVLSFIDNWKYYNGVDQYVDWSTTAPQRPPGNEAPNKNIQGDYSDALFAGPQGLQLKRNETTRHALFFSDTGAKQIYKNHVKFLLNRVNSYNNRVYKEDPTIIAWNLINEPRCEDWVGDANKDCPKRVQSWLDEMSTYVRSLDPNHLITVGSEGFFGYSTPQFAKNYNPANWSQGAGQDFVSNLNLSNIDYGTVHAWPDNWAVPAAQTPTFLKNWIMSHITAGQQVQPVKPIMFEEFGKLLTDSQQGYADMIQNLRDPVYTSVYQATQQAIQSGYGIAGSLFWKLAIPVFNGQNWRGQYGVMFDDTTMDVVKRNADFVKRLQNSLPPRPECNIDSWFPVESNGQRQCVKNSEAATAYYNPSSSVSDEAKTLVQKLKAGQVLVFPTQAACCKPGTGFFDQGCS